MLPYIEVLSISYSTVGSPRFANLQMLTIKMHRKMVSVTSIK